jgi:AmmeMemoRadiSam system protein B
LGFPADIRPSPIAGTWYPGTAEGLTQSVDRQLEQAAVVTVPGTVVGVIVPHAGHVYSGIVAAHAFRLLKGLRPRVVAVVSPLHLPYRGEVLSTAHSAYATPLGPIPVEQGLLSDFERHLKDTSGLRLARVRDDQEHSLEIELPFLQRTLAGPFHLLPVMLRDQSPTVARAVGQSLAAVLHGQPALLVGSSDLSHFYPDPIARQLDSVILGRIEAFDPAGVLAAEDEGAGSGGRLLALWWCALWAQTVHVLTRYIRRRYRRPVSVVKYGSNLPTASRRSPAGLTGPSVSTRLRIHCSTICSGSPPFSSGGRPPSSPRNSLWSAFVGRGSGSR